MTRTDSAAIVESKFAVGRWTVTITIQAPVRGQVTNMICEWDPETPKKLTAQEWAQYRAGRDAAIAKTGMRTLLVEL